MRRLDPTDGRVLGSFIPAASKGVALLASGRGRLWAGYGDMLVAIDPQDARVEGPIGTLDAQGKLLQTQGPQLTGLVLVDGCRGDPAWTPPRSGPVLDRSGQG